MTALKRIVTAAYQTTDGKTFDKKEDAAKHQRELARQSDIDALVAGQFAHNPDDGFLDAVTIGDVTKFIIDNADTLRDILPKRAKSVAPASQTGLVGGTPEVPPVPNAPGVQVGSPLAATASIALPAAAQPDAVASIAQPAFHFPAGLVGNVANQQALANA